MLSFKEFHEKKIISIKESRNWRKHLNSFSPSAWLPEPKKDEPEELSEPLSDKEKNKIIKHLKKDRLSIFTTLRDDEDHDIKFSSLPVKKSVKGYKNHYYHVSLKSVPRLLGSIIKKDTEDGKLYHVRGGIISEIK